MQINTITGHKQAVKLKVKLFTGDYIPVAIWKNKHRKLTVFSNLSYSTGMYDPSTGETTYFHELTLDGLVQRVTNHLVNELIPVDQVEFFL